MTRSGDPISSAGPGAASDTAADAPALWRTRAEQPGDEGAMRDLLLAAFDGTEEADLVEALRADPDAWIDGLSQVTVDDVRAGAGVGGADGWGSGERTLAQALLTRAYVGGEPVLALAPWRDRLPVGLRGVSAAQGVERAPELTPAQGGSAAQRPRAAQGWSRCRSQASAAAGPAVRV